MAELDVISRLFLARCDSTALVAAQPPCDQGERFVEVAVGGQPDEPRDFSSRSLTSSACTFIACGTLICSSPGVP